MFTIFKKKIRFLLNSLGVEVNPISTKQYLWLENLEIDTILDVGADIGQFALKINRGLPNKQIHSFEPVLESSLNLKKNLSKYPNINFYNTALGEVKKDVNFYINNFTASSSVLAMESLHKDIFPYTTNSKKTKVKQDLLDNFLNDSWQNILLKIDVQGYELNVLKGSIKTLHKTKVVIIETGIKNLYDGQSFFEEVYYFMKKSGFYYAGNYDQLKNPKNGEVLQVDAIFVKK